jgi:hypothetical protein
MCLCSSTAKVFVEVELVLQDGGQFHCGYSACVWLARRDGGGGAGGVYRALCLPNLR